MREACVLCERCLFVVCVDVEPLRSSCSPCWAAYHFRLPLIIFLLRQFSVYEHVGLHFCILDYFRLF